MGTKSADNGPDLSNDPRFKETYQDRMLFPMMGIAAAGAKAVFTIDGADTLGLSWSKDKVSFKLKPIPDSETFVSEKVTARVFGFRHGSRVKVPAGKRWADMTDKDKKENMRSIAQ